MKITKNTVNRGLDADQESLIVMEQMACNVVHHSNDAREGVAPSSRSASPFGPEPEPDVCERPRRLSGPGRVGGLDV